MEIDSRFSILDSRSNEKALHALANASRYFPGNRARLLSQFRAGDFLVPITSHQNNLVVYLHVIDLANINHHQIHRHPAKNSATLPPNQNGGVTIGKRPWISIRITS